MTRPDFATTDLDGAAGYQRHHGHDADPPDPISPDDVCFHMSDDESSWFHDAAAQVQRIVERERGAA